MFTGLVLGRGRITARRPGPAESLLTVESGVDLGEPLSIGESVSVSGVCLTVTAVSGDRTFQAYVSAETLRISTIGRQDEVNLERALRLSDRLGGHIVSGHVDGVGRIESVKPVGQSLACVISYPGELAPLVVPKGSIAIDGVSLTVNEASLTTLSVNIIPKTSEITTLSNPRPGREVNLETDIIGRHVRRLLETGSLSPSGTLGAGLTMETLLRQGY